MELLKQVHLKLLGGYEVKDAITYQFMLKQVSIDELAHFKSEIYLHGLPNIIGE